MPGLNLFKLSKNPKVGKSNIRITNRKSGLTPIEEEPLEVPSSVKIACHLLIMFTLVALFSAIGLTIFESSTRRELFSVLFSIWSLLPLMVIFFTLYLPFQILQKRRDALYVNALKAESNDSPTPFCEDLPVIIDVPSQMKIATAFATSIPVFYLSAFLFQTYFEHSSIIDLVFGILFFLLSWWYPIRIIKERKIAIELNAWQPKVVPRKRRGASKIR